MGQILLSRADITDICRRSEDAKDRLINTTDNLIPILEDLLASFSITGLNSQIEALRENTVELNRLLNKKFGESIEFLKTQNESYGKLGEEAAEAAANVSSNIG